MTTEHDEALVERVAFAIFCNDPTSTKPLWENLTETGRFRYRDKARLAIYPPAPPKTRLQVARELLFEAYTIPRMRREVLTGVYDKDSDMRAVLAALALPAMED